MTVDQKAELLNQIAAADIGQLRRIIVWLESMDQTPNISELIDIAEDNIDMIAGTFGDDQ